MSDLRIEKLSMESTDITQENINKIKELFPQVLTEGKIDFDVLKTILGEQIENQNERYQFTWNGKSDTIRFAQKPSTGTLRPDKESSKNWDTTENLYIEGDNLEVLKLLQKTYHNKIKMIYIDPPYNTGGDFVYKDDFKDSIKNYKEQTNQTLRTNPETSGRYHTDWLNMMYSRLMLAKNLLTEDGAIFIHIDENEIFNLQNICREIFGESNELGTIIWDKRNPKGASTGVAYQHESILVYCKSLEYFSKIKFSKNKENAEEMLMKVKSLIRKHGQVNEEVRKQYKDWLKGQKLNFSGGELAYQLIDSNGDIYRLVSMAAPDKPETRSKRPLIHPITKKECPVPAKGWRYIDSTMDDLIENNKIEFGKDENTQPTQKYFLNDNLDESVASLIYYGGSDDAMSLPFDNPKPIYIAKRIINSLLKNKNEMVLDFFSGSSTTAHAVMQLNAEDGGNRKFIMVQLPEKTDEKSEAFKAGYNNICEIGKERIRRAGEKIKNELVEKNQKAGMLEESINPEKLDIGFKVYKLDSSNFNVFDSSSKDINNIFNHDVFLSDRSKLDILYEILLKYGVFDKPVEVLNINNKEAYSVAFGHMLVFINQEITEQDITEVVALKPREVIIDERGFKTDNDKMNAVIRLEAAGVEKISTI